MPGIIPGNVPIAYELSGPEDGTPILFLNGLGLQLTQWPPAMIEAFENAGYRVLRIDNRDIGLSGRLKGKRAPHPIVQYGMRMFGMSAGAPYKIEDMADDAARVLDALGITETHIVGLSMGGIIAQVLSGGAPSRVLSLTCIMTTTGNRSLPLPSMDILKRMSGGGKAETLDDAVEGLFNVWSLIGTQDGGLTDDELRAWIRESIERGFDMSGQRRQTAAILETGDIRHYTEAVKAPTLVIHGTADPLVNIAGGQDIAKTVPNAEIELIEGMGHDLPPKHTEFITERMLRHMAAAHQSQAAPVSA